MRGNLLSSRASVNRSIVAFVWNSNIAPKEVLIISPLNFNRNCQSNAPTMNYGAGNLVEAKTFLLGQMREIASRSGIAVDHDGNVLEIRFEVRVIRE